MRFFSDNNIDVVITDNKCPVKMVLVQFTHVGCVLIKYYIILYIIKSSFISTELFIRNMNIMFKLD